jgi:hypothetical protein
MALIKWSIFYECEWEGISSVKTPRRELPRHPSILEVGNHELKNQWKRAKEHDFL